MSGIATFPRAFVLALFALAPAVALAQVPARLPTLTLTAGIHLVRAEVAYTNEGRMQGLMFRKSLGPNEGMLFVFPQDERHCMWMKNTYVPLSVAYMDAKGRIVSIHDMEPQTENSHCALAEARYALEMGKGWFKGKGISAGAQIGGINKAPPPQ